ncbi:unnamed protein product [Candidula unifasciata]|uniref:Cytochrome P450 n=1 Tax=Candidula unifasciata TaxID=100452 RepID=A0A8S3Z7S9_9EUPU|nr:unnamed protein product [Candidula unifasciata]
MDLITWIVAGFIILVFYLLLRGPNPRLPPSPVRPLPVVGHLMHLKADLRSQFREWAEQCGDMFSLYMGGSLVVVLNGYDVIKEAMVKKGDLMSDRPPVFIDQISGLSQKGIVFSNGQLWKEQKSVCLSILRSFGMGKNLLAEKIQEEVDCFMTYLASLEGNPTDIHLHTGVVISNIICSILIGNRFDYDDEKFQDLLQKLNRVLEDQSSISLVNFFPWLRKLPGDLFKAKRMSENMLAIRNVFVNFLQEKKRNVDDSDEVLNFIDAYLKEKKKKTKPGESTTLDDQNLIKDMMDLFGGGTETTTSTIYWCILYLLNNPQVQDKVYSEIKDVIGSDRTPTMQDKGNLKYLNAVIMETERLANIIHLAVPHMCTNEVTLRGYILPKGTTVCLNLDSVLHDKATWGEDALNFCPERFIDSHGRVQIPKQFIPFGIGHRICIGEAMAKMVLFLCLASMFQKFKFLPSNPHSIPPIEYHCGGVVSPKPYKVRVVARQ